MLIPQILKKQIIITDNGKKNVSKIKVGDIVLGKDNCPNTVKSIEKITSKSCVEINNGDFYFYENQIISVNGHFSHAFKIKKGDSLKHISGDNITVTSVKKINKKYSFFKLGISGDHTYYLDGVLVHNSTMYWYGGTGNWSDYAAHWSYNSGNSPADPASNAPTSTDDVIFDTLSHTTNYTMTVNATANCANLTMGAPASGKITWAGSSALNIYGSLNLSGGTAGITRTYAGTITFRATSGTKTIDFNGITFRVIVFNGLGGTFQLTNTLTSTGGASLTLTAGTFDANGQTVSFESLAQNDGINGNFTFYNLTRISGASQVSYLSLSSDITVSNTLTLTGNSVINRLMIKSSVVGTPRTITAASISATYCDFTDIIGAGAGSWNLSAITGGSGDCGGNSGITFTTPTDQHWVNADGGSWGTAANWTSRVPLPQDDIYMDCSFNTAKTITMNVYRIGKSIDWTGATWTTSLTWGFQTDNYTYYIFGSLTLINNLTIPTGAYILYFKGRGDYIFTPNSSTLGFGIDINNITGTLSLGGNLATSSQLKITEGEFSAINGINNYIISVRDIYISSNGTLTLGSATHILTQTTGSALSNFGTVNAGTSTIKLTGALTGNIYFYDYGSGSGSVYYNFWNATTNAYQVIIYNDNTWNDFKIDAGRTMKFETGSTQTVNSFTAVGTAGNLITLSQLSGSNSFFLYKASGNVVCDYLHLTYCSVGNNSNWYAGSNSVDNGNNEGWNWGDFFDKELTEIVSAITIFSPVQQKDIIEAVKIVSNLVKQAGRIFTQVIQAISEIAMPLVKIFTENFIVATIYANVLTASKIITQRLVPRPVYSKVLTAKKILTQSITVIGSKTAQVGRTIVNRFILSSIVTSVANKVLIEIVRVISVLTKLLTAAKTLIETVFIVPIFSNTIAIVKTLTDTIKIISSNTYSILNIFIERVALSENTVYQTFSTFVERVILAVENLTLVQTVKALTERLVVSGRFISQVSRMFIEVFIVAPIFDALKVILKTLTDSFTAISSMGSFVIGKLFVITIKVIDTKLSQIGRIITESLVASGSIISNTAKTFVERVITRIYPFIWYPPAQSDTYVKATTKLSTSYWPFFTTDPAKPLIGNSLTNQWITFTNSITNQRFHIDLGSAKVINRIYYENSHNSGNNTEKGAKGCIIQGSNNPLAFANLTYATNTYWDTLVLSFNLQQHVNSNIPDPKIINISNTTPYRYYAFKFANNWGDSRYMGIRRIELIEAPISTFTIILKAFKVLTSTIGVKVNLVYISVFKKILTETIVATGQILRDLGRVFTEIIIATWSKIFSLPKTFIETITSSQLVIDFVKAKGFMEVIKMISSTIVATTRLFTETIKVVWQKLTNRSFVYIQSLIVGSVLMPIIFVKTFVLKVIGSTSWLFNKQQYYTITNSFKVTGSAFKNLGRILTDQIKIIGSVLFSASRLFVETIVVVIGFFEGLFTRIYNETLKVGDTLGSWSIGKIIEQTVKIFGYAGNATSWLMTEVLKAGDSVVTLVNKVLVEIVKVYGAITRNMARIYTQTVRIGDISEFSRILYKTLTDSVKATVAIVFGTGKALLEAFVVVGSIGNWAVGKLIIQPLMIISTLIKAWTLSRVYTEVINVSAQLIYQSGKMLIEMFVVAGEFILGTISKIFIETVNIVANLTKTWTLSRVFTQTIIVAGNVFTAAVRVFSEIITVVGSFILGTISKILIEVVKISHSTYRSVARVFTQIVRVSAISIYLTGRILLEVLSMIGALASMTIGKILIQTVKIGLIITHSISRLFTQTIKIIGIGINHREFTFTETLSAISAMGNFVIGKLFNENVIAQWHRARFILNGIMVGLWKKVARVTNGIWHKIKRDDN